MIKNENCLKKFETKNPFYALLNDWNEDRQQVLNTSRRKLRKCGKCGFKKRSCILDNDECRAVDKSCKKCNKAGHFPKSLNCKANKRQVSSKNKDLAFKIKHKYCDINPDQYSKDILLLVNIKIQQLQLFEHLHTSRRQSSKNDDIKESVSNNHFINKEETRGERSHGDQTRVIPVNLVPFLVMFILFNHDIFKNKLHAFKRKNKFRKISFSAKAIKKVAISCAKKFVNCQEIHDDHFNRYCMKRASCLLNQEIPSKKEQSNMKTILQVYDRMYFKSITEHGDPDQRPCKMRSAQFDKTYGRQCREDEDTNEEVTNYEANNKFLIPQFDGACDTDSSFDEDVNLENSKSSRNNKSEGEEKVIDKHSKGVRNQGLKILNCENMLPIPCVTMLQNKKSVSLMVLMTVYQTMKRAMKIKNNLV